MQAFDERSKTIERPRFLLLLTAILSLLVLAACTPVAELARPTTVAPTATSNASLSGPVVDVVDGDTVKVHLPGGTETVRIIGIDTPETVAPGQPIECFGPEASARAEELLAGQRVTLLPDPTQDRRDRFNRLLAYVEVGGDDFGLAMIAAGYANEYTYDRPYERQAQYRAAEDEAQSKGLGLWAANTCSGANGQAPASPTQAPTSPTGVDTAAGVSPITEDDCPASHPIKGNIGSNGNIYHVPGRSSYAATNPEVCFASAEEAGAAGFRAPRN